MKKLVKISIATFVIACLAILSIISSVQLRYIKKLYPNIHAIEPAPYAIILGASVQKNGNPSDALRDRLLVGQALYEQKIVPKLLVTGDDGLYHIDETKVMRAFLEENGVPPNDIIEDGHGYRTYESCKRAVQEYGIKRAIIVTQRFHIGRALYLCNQLGLDAWGISSDLTAYVRIVYFTARDMAASLEAWWDVNIKAPKSPVQY